MAGGSDTVKDCVTRLEEFVGTPLVEDSVCLAAQCAESASELVAFVTDMESLVDVFKANIRVVEEDVSLLKKVSHDLENFLWEMEQYFKVARISEEEKVTVTCMVPDDASARPPEIETWTTLSKELRDQFLPNNT
ncbi:unnamed protein product, partial [Prunus brigantina]